jgi:hypothetical protein
MWIFRYTYCLILGHGYMDVVTNDRHSYQYCLHCGKIKEPSSIIKNHSIHSVHENS